MNSMTVASPRFARRKSPATGTDDRDRVRGEHSCANFHGAFAGAAIQSVEEYAPLRRNIPRLPA
jgi:hypothetical protein